MSDEIDSLSVASSVGDRFPFLSVLATLFFNGGVFLVFNVPALVALAQRKTFSGLDDFVLTGFLAFWGNIFTATNGAVVLAALLFLSLVLGLLLTPVDRLATFIVISLIQPLERNWSRKHCRKSRLLFSAAEFGEGSSASFMAWLMTQRFAKAHWEWELFLYQLHWGLFANVLIFVVVASYLMWAQVVTWQLLLLGSAAVFIVLSYGIARSFAMGAVHDFYSQRFRSKHVTSSDQTNGEAATK